MHNVGNCGRAESLPQTSVTAHTACKAIRDVNLFFEYIFIIGIKFDRNNQLGSLIKMFVYQKINRSIYFV